MKAATGLFGVVVAVIEHEAEDAGVGRRERERVDVCPSAYRSSA